MYQASPRPSPSGALLLQNSRKQPGSLDTSRDNNDEVRCPCSPRVDGETGRVAKPAEGERQLRPEGVEGYTFEYINVCNFEFVLEWASAILSGGY